MQKLFLCESVMGVGNGLTYLYPKLPRNSDEIDSIQQLKMLILQIDTAT